VSECVPATRVAVDAGSLVTKIAVSGGIAGPSPQEPSLRTEQHTGAAGLGRERAALTAALAAARESRAVQADGAGDIHVSLAVPDAWLDGSAEGAQRHEALRYLAEDQFGLPRVSWVGQLASVAMLAASQRGFAEPGRYLVCDIGGHGVRVAACEVMGRTVRQLAVHDVPGGGWLDFDAAIRTTLKADSDPGLGAWYLSAIAQDRRAKLVFEQARNAPEFRDARAYSLTGAASSYELTAGQAADCFAPTVDRIRTGLAAVLGAATPTVVVLTGGLAWFPQAQQAVAEAARVASTVLGPEAAALGALLLAGGEAHLAPHGLPPVTLPTHQVRDGLLEESGLPLPWTDSFALQDDELLVLEDPELTLDIGNRRVTLPVPGLASGQYRVGVRPSWSGTGVVVLRAQRVSPSGQTAVPGHCDADRDVHVLPLDLKEMPR
jgi:hypothetical protein